MAGSIIPMELFGAGSIYVVSEFSSGYSTAQNSGLFEFIMSKRTKYHNILRVQFESGLYLF